jgi:hypothetical protein
MNQRERAIIDRLDGVIREIASLTPANPADLKAVAANLPVATAAAKSLTRVISALRCGDWAEACIYLDRAERTARLR